MRGLRGEETLMVVLFLKVVILFSHSKGFFQDGDWGPLLLVCCLVIQMLAVYNFPTRKKAHNTEDVFRPGVSSGVYCVLLLPLVMMMETMAHPAAEGELLFAVGSCCGLLMSAPLQLQKTCGALHVLLLTVSTITVIILHILHGAELFAWLCGMTVTMAVCHHLPQLCVGSFTWGELCVVCQVLGCAVFRMASWLHHFCFSTEWPVVTNEMYVYIFVSVVVLCVVAASALLLYWDWSDTLVPFLGVYFAMGLIAVGVLIFLTAHNPLLWIFWFILQHNRRVWLLAWWSIITMVTVIIFSVYTQCVANRQSPAGNGVRASTVARKVFHVVVVVVYIPGLVTDTLLLFLASVIALVTLCVLEIARLIDVQWLGPALDNSFRVFVDDRDQGPVLLTHIYLLMGLSLPLWLSHKIIGGGLALWCGVMSLGIGDTVACAVGMRYGNTKWPGTKKSVEGTAAAVIVQVLVLLLAVYAGWLDSVPWLSTLFAVGTTSVYEAFTSQIDNLVLPLFMMAALSPVST